MDEKERLQQILEEQLNEDLINIIISNPREKDGVLKIHIRPILLKGNLIFQCASYTKKQVFHENLEKNAVKSRVLQWMEQYRQLNLESDALTAICLVSKKNKWTLKVKKKKSDNVVDINTANKISKAENLLHNRKKAYILDPNTKVPFLMDLGVQTSDGKIVSSKYDKFRQINRFLEFIKDIKENLPKDREAVIIDFGCGKSYLTFALYYYLHELEKMPIRVIGLDLKEEVIKNCSELAKSYGYDNLQFLIGDIADYEGVDQVDMVVTLHACDTATDYALAKAVKWGAKVILSVPCCQHELNQQMNKNKIENSLSTLFSYGIIKERSAALFTDAIRGKLLEEQGYDVDLLEFIDMEHTPKNILLRATKKNSKLIDVTGGNSAKKKETEAAKLEDALSFLGVEPTLKRLLEEK